MNVVQTTSDIAVDDLRAMLARGEPVTILDIRPASEFAEWHIPGSLNIDAYQALKAGDQHVLDDVQLSFGPPVVTICAVGKTSAIAAAQLRERGFHSVSLTGGLKAWSTAWNTAEVALSGSDATVIQIRRTGKGCLSYLIGSGPDAIVIDPSVEPGIYQTLADDRGWTIRHVLDTHLHADHLSRGRLLAEDTGAVLHLPANDRATFRFAGLRDGDRIQFGSSTLVGIRTPGHTAESTTYLLDDRAIFTGDTLFLGSVGRPDLHGASGETDQRARALWSSLRKFAGMPGETLVLPGHTSAPIPFDQVPIGASLADVWVSTPMLHLDQDRFVTTILARLPPTPPNHASIVALNEGGNWPDGDPTDLEAGANRCAIP